MPRLAGPQDLGRNSSDRPRTHPLPPSYEFGEVPAELDADLGGWMREHLENVKQTHRLAKINAGHSKAIEHIDGLRDKFANDPEIEPEALKGSFRAALDRGLPPILEGARDPEVEQSVSDFYRRRGAIAETAVLAAGRERVYANGRVALDGFLDKSTDAYAGSSRPGDLDEIDGEVRGRIEAARRTGALAADEAAGKYRDWKEAALKARGTHQLAGWTEDKSYLAALKALETGSFDDPQVQEAHDALDPAAQMELRYGALKQLDAQRTARRQAAEAAERTLRQEIDALVVALHRTDDAGQRRELLDGMEKAGVLPGETLDRLREDLEEGEGTGAGDDPWAVSILQGGILRGAMGLADITGADGLSPQGRRKLIDLWEANRDPALAKGIDEIRKGLGITRGAAPADDATVETAADAIAELKERAAREENPDVRAIGRELLNEAKETVRKEQAEPGQGGTFGIAADPVGYPQTGGKAPAGPDAGTGPRRPRPDEYQVAQADGTGDDQLAMGYVPAALRAGGRFLLGGSRAVVRAARNKGNEIRKILGKKARQLREEGAPLVPLEPIAEMAARRFAEERAKSPKNKKVDFAPADLGVGLPDDDAVQAFVEAHLAGVITPTGQDAAQLSLGEVTPDFAARLKGDTGIDVTGMKHVIDTVQINHTFNRHGPEGEGDETQVPISPEALSVYREVVENYDGKPSVRRKKSSTTITFRKNIDGVVVVVEQVRTAKGEFAFYTMWIEAAPAPPLR